MGPLLSPLLVGRDDLLALADRRIEEAAAGRGQVVLLAGEAGIGKTRLLRAVLRKADAAGFRIAQADLAPQDRLVPLASTKDLARTMREVPAFGSLGDELLSMQGGQGGDTLGSRRILVRDLAERIANAIDRPTVLSFEDLQWADEMSLEVIGEIARLVADRPALRDRGLPRRRDAARHEPSRVAGPPAQPAPRRGGASRTAVVRGDGAGDLADPRDRAARPARGGERGLRAHRRHPAAHRGAAGRARRRRAIRREGHPQRPRAEHDRGRDHGALRPPVRRRARGRARRRRRRPLLRAGRPRRDHGPQGRRPRRRAGRARGQLLPVHVQLGRPGLLRLPPPAPAGRALRDRAGPASCAGCTPAPPSSGRGSSARPRSTRRCTSSAPGSGPRPIERRARAPSPRVRCPAATRPSSSTAGRSPTPRTTCRRRSAASCTRRTWRRPSRWTTSPRSSTAPPGPGSASWRPAGSWTPRGRSSTSPAWRAATSARSRSASASSLRPRRSCWRSRSPRAGHGRCPTSARCRAHRDRRRSSWRTAAARFDEARGPPAAVDRTPTRTTSTSSPRRRTSSKVAWSEGLATMLRVANDARGARKESTGVTAFRWAAHMAVRVMDYPTARIGIGEGLQYADEIEQSYCRHVLAATSAHVAWTEGRWDDAIPIAEIELVERGSRRGTLGSRDALGLRRVRSRRGRARAHAARGIARDRAVQRGGVPGPAADVGPRRDRARCRASRRSAIELVRARPSRSPCRPASGRCWCRSS